MRFVDMESLGDARWVMVRALSAGFKDHLIPRELLSQFSSDVITRSVEPGGGIDEVKPAGRQTIDLPGMISTVRKLRTIDLGGAELVFPSHDFLHFLGELDNARPRKFPNGQEHYVIHGYMMCAMFTPIQREDVLEEMRRQLDEALVEGRADEHSRDMAFADLNATGMLCVGKVPEPKGDA